VLSCFVLSCLILSCSCLVLSCVVVVLSCCVVLCLVLSILVLSRLVLSCLVLSCGCLVLSCGCLVLSWGCLVSSFVFVVSCGCPVFFCRVVALFCLVMNQSLHTRMYRPMGGHQTLETGGPILFLALRLSHSIFGTTSLAFYFWYLNSIFGTRVEEEFCPYPPTPYPNNSTCTLSEKPAPFNRYPMNRCSDTILSKI
jgi:hypothetical protein